MITVRTNQASVPAFVLASLVSAYPTEDFADDVKTLLSDEALGCDGGARTQRSLAALKEKLVPCVGEAACLQDLRSEFIDRFERARGASLYETEYGRSRALVKGNELADIAAFYRAFGLETGGSQPEMLDHLAVELEFYALLLLKYDALEEAGDAEGVEVVLDARKKFLKDHLGRFIGAIADRPAVKESEFYSSAISFCRDLVADECDRLGVKAENVDWLEGEQETGEMACGGAVGCMK